MQEYSRLVGIDVGKKRIGIAQTDLLKTFATPVGTFSPATVFEELKNIVSQSKVERFIVGWPLAPNGLESPSTKMVEEFVEKLVLNFPDIPISKVDETNTSNKAIQVMVQSGTPQKKRRQKDRVDRIAAALILERYLQDYK